MSDPTSWGLIKTPVETKCYISIVTKISRSEVLLERYYENLQLKFKAVQREMPESMEDFHIGKEKKFKNYNTIDYSRHGFSYWYWENGNLFKSGLWDDCGLETGHWKIFWPNGNIKEEGIHFEGQRKLIWNFYAENGMKIENLDYGN